MHNLLSDWHKNQQPSFFSLSFFSSVPNTLTQDRYREGLCLCTRSFRNGVLFATTPFLFLPFFNHTHTFIALQLKTSTNPTNTTQRPFPKMAMERKQPHSYKDVYRYWIAEIESWSGVQDCSVIVKES